MGLPKILADRVPNRGSEGLTVDEKGRVFALIQSPLNVDGKTAKTAKYTRIVEFDPVTKETTMYAYPVDTGYKNTGAAKIGDITSIGKGQFLMIEQGKQHGEMQNLIYKVDLNGATPIADNGDLEYGRLDGKIVPAKKELVLDLRAQAGTSKKPKAWPSCRTARPLPSSTTMTSAWTSMSKIRPSPIRKFRTTPTTATKKP